jgi:hypothetical protein
MIAPLRGLSPFRSCPAPWKVTRAAAEGPDLKMARHLAVCGRCAAELAAMRALVEQAAALSGPTLRADVRETIAARLLASGVPPARRSLRRPLVAAAAASGALAAAVALVAVVAERPRAPAPAPVAILPPRPASAATIRAFGDARFSRKQSPPDEIVELQAGTIDLDVTPLQAGARFRVLAFGSEVEVRGTSFRVSAGSGRLEEVRVWRGHVEVRSAAGGATALGPGDSWSAAQAVAVEDPRPPPVRSTAPDRPRTRARLVTRRPPAPLEAPAPASPPTASFHRAWALLRAGDAIAAAEAFAGVQDASRGTSLEADALYWRAVALSRAGERRASRDLYDVFLARFPASPRAGEAAVALGFLLVDLGQPVEARQAFTRAQEDPSDRVRASARLGLDRLRQQR